MKSSKPFYTQRSKSQSSQVGFAREGGKVPSFAGTLEAVRRQIEIECFGEAEADQAEEIALIIAEVMKLPPEASVRIGGNDIPASLAAEVFCRIGHDHVLSVLEHYNGVTYEIKHTKTYLRTALYNAVFEINGRAANRVYAGMPWLANR